MREISRDPWIWSATPTADTTSTRTASLLFTGTMFAPTDDRDAPGQGFTHKDGDIVTISTRSSAH